MGKKQGRNQKAEKKCAHDSHFRDRLGSLHAAERVRIRSRTKQGEDLAWRSIYGDGEDLAWRGIYWRSENCGHREFALQHPRWVICVLPLWLPAVQQGGVPGIKMYCSCPHLK